MRELKEWALRDYGIDMTPHILAKNKDKYDIQNEADFIFKIKQKYIKRRNDRVAAKI